MISKVEYTKFQGDEYYLSINPEIIKFWETQGWRAVVKPSFQVITLVRNHEEITLASWRFKPINYFYEGNFISEKKMLRIINLKAFF